MASGSFPSDIVNANGVAFFRAPDGVNGAELWKSNGTAAGTVLLGDIWPGSTGSSPKALARVGTRLYFAAIDGVSGTELWSFIP